MQFLIDTNVLIWYSEANSKLSSEVYELISNGGNIKYVSVASVWELAIKINLGKIRLQDEFKEFIEKFIFQNGFSLLEIQVTHLIKVSQLEKHHN
ncbi:MAG: type II toxin-antitoxin system VapC family toxin, partial [Ignavibacteria bacterium]|nr:type II toxin-antitoxin system VapC family toxin [Ignavibacteria bacterium]